MNNLCGRNFHLGPQLNSPANLTPVINTFRGTYRMETTYFYQVLTEQATLDHAKRSTYVIFVHAQSRLKPTSFAKTAN